MKVEVSTALPVIPLFRLAGTLMFSPRSVHLGIGATP
jgi:hypothetical protein